VVPRIFPTVDEALGRLGQHVNTSRGPIVDEATLIDSARHLPGAQFIAYPVEPR
jgi:phosphoglycerate dehydrogenase-like enzyme